MDDPFASRPRPDWLTVAREVGSLYELLDAGGARQSGHGWGSARSSVRVRQGSSGGDDVEVETSTAPVSELQEPTDQLILSEWLVRLPEMAPTFPLTITVDRWQESVLVDDAPVPFAFIGARDNWIA